MIDTIILQRWADHEDHGVLGEIYHEGKIICKTIERPFINNRPFVSCVPARTYELQPFTRKNGDEVYCLVNHELNIEMMKSQLGGMDGRYAILIHKGNWMTDLAGCIAPGLDYGYGYDKEQVKRLMVTNSTEATKKLFDYIKEHEIKKLAIVWKKH